MICQHKSLFLPSAYRGQPIRCSSYEVAISNARAAVVGVQGAPQHYYIGVELDKD
jgi:hypothetical protein